jgi:hypothetical protein
LLSNAVKYTKQGGITVKAQLLPANGEHKLQIKIIDTAPVSAQSSKPGFFLNITSQTRQRGKLARAWAYISANSLLSYKTERYKGRER